MRTGCRCSCVTVVVIFLCLTLSPLASAAERVVIEHLISAAKWGQATVDATQRIAELFNSQQNEVTVKVVLAPGNANSYENLVLTRIAGGSPPDVITSNRFGDMAINGVLASLTPFLERDNLLKQLITPAVEYSTWDGAMLMLPQVVQPMVTYYNPDLFAETGLTDPNTYHQAGNWDWAMVRSTAAKISADKNGDQVPDVLGTGITIQNLARSGLWVHQAGGTFFDSWTNPRQSRVNSPQVASALQFLHGLIYESQAMLLDHAVSGAANTQFASHKIGMLFEGPWYIGTVRSLGYYDWDVAPVAKGPAHAGTTLQVEGIQLVKDSPHHQAAWQWMRFLIFDPQAYNIFTQMTGRPPAVARGLQTYLKVVVDRGKPIHVDTFAHAMMNPIVAPVVPPVPKVSEIMTAYNAEMLKYMRNTQALETTLLRIDEAINRILKQLPR